jgi:long-chain acyl-CoA synthetase
MKDSPPETLNDLLRGVAAARPDLEVLRFNAGGTWTGLTGRELAARVRNAALGLYSQGVRKDDRVALLAESGPEWTITDFAILSIGAINVPIYPTQAVPQVEYILSESEPKLLFVSTARQFKRVSSVLDQFPALRVIPFQALPTLDSSLAKLEEEGARQAAAQPGLHDQLSAGVKGSDLASIIYTSGTTGEPKGVMLTHRNILFNALASGEFLKIESDNSMLSFLPLSHILERMVLYLCLHFGVQINYAGGIETVIKDLATVRPTLMSAVPRMLEKVYGRIQKKGAAGSGFERRAFEWSLGIARKAATLENEGRRPGPLLRLERIAADRLVLGKIRDAFGGRMRRLVSGGAALPADLAQVFIGAGVPVLQGYGMTETSPVIAVNSLDENRIGTVGKPLPGIDVAIAEDGEILTRGPHVFKGYYNKPGETKEAFEQEGSGEPWLKTGDVGYFDSDGFLVITDRKKDLIKTSAGKYVAPQALEGLLAQSKFVEQAFVIGNDRKYVSALIVPDFEHLSAWAKEQGIEVPVRADLIKDHRVEALVKSEVSRLTSGLADYEKVKRFALLPNELTIEGGEMTPTLKARRPVINEKYKEIIESLYPAGSEA